jgi:hypothetical protein
MQSAGVFLPRQFFYFLRNREYSRLYLQTREVPMQNNREQQELTARQELSTNLKYMAQNLMCRWPDFALLVYRPRQSVRLQQELAQLSPDRAWLFYLSLRTWRWIEVVAALLVITDCVKMVVVMVSKAS